MKLFFEEVAKYFYWLAAAALLSVLALFYFNTQKVKSTSDLVEHTWEVLAKSDQVLLDVLSIESNARGYVLTGNEKFLAPFQKSALTIDGNLAALKSLTAGNPSHQARLDSMLETGYLRKIELTKIIESKKKNELSESEINLFVEKALMFTDKIKDRVAALKSEEFRLLAKRKVAAENSNKNYDYILLLLFVFTSITFALVFLILKNQKIREKDAEAFSVVQKTATHYSRNLIEASLDPLITINTDGKITDMNDALATITGETRAHLLGTDFGVYFTEPEKAREIYREVFKKGFVKDYPLTIIDDELTPVLFNGSVYKNEQGIVLGAVVVARVITEQKRVEKELTEARVFAELATALAIEEKGRAETATKSAEDAVKSKQQFLSNMSHEIRTPMNAILGFTKVILKTNLSVRQKEYMSAIKISGDSLIVLINDILDLAKVDAGKMTFEKTPFKLGMSISAMLHLFETKIQEKNLRLVKIYDPKIPEVLIGDPVRLHQIILNLLSNAVKFTATGHITVSVVLLHEDGENATIQFSVSDTGTGIAADKLESIFENFQQASSETSRLYGGTGLGLAIVKQLVEPQGGTIYVKSTVDEGSTFSFTLNFQKTNEAAILETETVELDSSIKNIKVLVVEDMVLNQLLMKTILDEFGFERDIAENGKIAVEKLSNKSYDIILMDLQMPEMNGFEATEHIRKTMNSKIPIIALTADVTTVDLVKCKAAGMNDYVAKPVDERVLYNKIIGLVKKPTLSLLQKSPEASETKKVKYTDLNYLSQRTKSNPVLMMEMISAYLEQTPPLISVMKQSFHEKNWDSLHAAVHKMLPSFSIMGIHPDFEGMAKKIQEYARTQEQMEEMQDLVLQLETVCVQACMELEEEFNTIKNTKK